MTQHVQGNFTRYASNISSDTMKARRQLVLQEKNCQPRILHLRNLDLLKMVK